jgi:3-hydroxyisobutyrate dehydrogenase-like beta-hydroxyacid dehydrogenase
MSILASGGGGMPICEALVPWGMNIEFVGPKLGTASGIKILRSVVMKGMEALLVECVLASRHYGVDEYIINSIDKAFSRSFRDMANALLTTGAIHAERRSEEVAMSGEAVADAGVSPIMSTAAAQRLRWVADLGLKKHFKGVVPPTYEVVMAAIENMGGRA